MPKSSSRVKPLAKTPDQVVACDLEQANEQLIIAGLREQALAEQALRSAAELKALLENMMEGISVFDAENQPVLVNPLGRRLLGFAKTKLGLADYRKCDLRTPDDQRLDFERDVLSRVGHEPFADEEIVVRREDGRRCHIVMNGSAVRDAQGRVSLAIIAFRDVTALRELERQRRQYIALISHDLLGPLATARMAAEQMIGAPEPQPDIEDKSSLLQVISRNLARADRMVRDFLDVHRLAARQPLVLRLAECDAVDIVREVTTELSSLHGDRFRVQGAESARGIWSAGEIRRAVWNLATNAAKYGAPETPITLRVECTQVEVALSVHNLGTPIPPQGQARLFEPFSRSRSSASGGWGLGLTLVRGCAEAHGGRVRVESRAEAGTTFTIVLPLDASSHQAEIASQPQSERVPTSDA